MTASQIALGEATFDSQRQM